MCTYFHLNFLIQKHISLEELNTRKNDIPIFNRTYINLFADWFEFEKLLIKRWSEGELFTIFENHVYSH